MVRNELKIKYKNSVLGFAWSLLNPLLYLVVFYIAFTIILGSGIPAFPIWLLSGLLGLEPVLDRARRGDRLGRRQLRPREEGVVPARDPAARRGRQHARALLPAERGAVRRARDRALGRRVVRTSRSSRSRSSCCCCSRARSGSCSRRSTSTCATRRTSSSSRCSRGSGSRRSCTSSSSSRARPGWSKWPWFANPVTPIVLDLPARDLRAARQPAHERRRRTDAAAAALAVLGIRRVPRLLARLRADHRSRSRCGCSVARRRTSRRSSRWRPRSRSAASRSSSSCTTSTTRR